LEKLFKKVKEFGLDVGNIFVNVYKALKGEQVDWSTVWANFSIDRIDSGVTVNGINPYDENGHFKGLSKSEKTAVLKEVNSKQAEDINAQISNIDKRINSMEHEILINEALKNQDLADYGSTDPNKDGSDNKKSVEEMIELAERYHEIKKQIEAINHELDILSKKKDRAFGKAKVKLMDQEIEKLGELKEKEKELLDAQTVFLASDKVAVEETFKGAKFDEDGNISNYSQLQA
jgi:DNA-binding FrmR family transcriptional regulator